MATCSVNNDCPKGYCCEEAAPQNCSLWANCYNGDGKYDIGIGCSKNSQCATRCCNDFLKICGGTSNPDNDCVPEGLPGWAIAIIVLVVIGIIGGVIGCILCCVCAHRRRSRREKENVPSQQLTVVQTGGAVPGSGYPVQGGQPQIYSSMPGNTVVIQQAPGQQFNPAQLQQLAQQGQSGQPVQFYTPQPVGASK